jgi:hypothetical protein
MEIVQALAVLAGVAVSFYSLRNLPARTRKRSTLKADIEIYHLLDKSDPQREVVKRSIDASVNRMYGTGARNLRDVEWTQIITGVVMVLGFGFWTAYLVKDGFTWWAIATGLGAFSGLMLIPEAFERQVEREPDGENGSDDTSSDAQEPLQDEGSDTS